MPESSIPVLVSVVIPCFNVEQYIRDCLDSVLRQTYSELEIICVDDGSTDATVVILETYGKHIRLILSDHRGASSARNLGLAQANGKYIQFLDADDLLLADKISHQVALFESTPGACFIAGKYSRQGLDGLLDEVELRSGDPWVSLAISRMGITSSNFWRKCVLEAVNGWDENARSSQEANLMFRILQLHREVIFDTQCLTIVRDRHRGSIRIKEPVRGSIRWMKLRRDMHDYLEDAGQLSRYRKESIEIAMLGAIRILDSNNRHLAYMYYRKHLDGWLDLRDNRLLDAPYKMSIKLLGFTVTERIAHAVRFVFNAMASKQTQNQG
ncbi:glycosyltransferase family 2 protein [Pseudomonadota bacterium]